MYVLQGIRLSLANKLCGHAEGFNLFDLEEKMEDVPKKNRNECMQRCEAGFIKFVAKKPVGGVEALRLCRENCRNRDGLNPSANTDH